MAGRPRHRRLRRPEPAPQLDRAPAAAARVAGRARLAGAERAGGLGDVRAPDPGVAGDAGGLGPAARRLDRRPHLDRVEPRQVSPGQGVGDRRHGAHGAAGGDRRLGGDRVGGGAAGARDRHRRRGRRTHRAARHRGGGSEAPGGAAAAHRRRGGRRGAAALAAVPPAAAPARGADAEARGTPPAAGIVFGIVANLVAWVGYGVAFWLLARGLLPRPASIRRWPSRRSRRRTSRDSWRCSRPAASGSAKDCSFSCCRAVGHRRGDRAGAGVAGAAHDHRVRGRGAVSRLLAGSARVAP